MTKNNSATETKTKNNKATRVLNWIKKYPEAGNAEVAAQMGASVGYVWRLRRLGVSVVEPVETPLKPISANAIQMGGDHYKQSAVQPWDVFDTWPLQQRIGAYRANCTKYVMRLDSKDTPLLNAQKLAHYAQKLVEVLEQAQ